MNRGTAGGVGCVCRNAATSWAQLRSIVVSSRTFDSGDRIERIHPQFQILRVTVNYRQNFHGPASDIFIELNI